MLITIFTPTYNRAYRLPALYESLKGQTCFDFEWLIIDDGSTDNTENIVSTWLGEHRFSIRYIKQQNGGKHRAVNRGVKEANGELFFIADSDDTLTHDAVELVIKEYNEIKGNPSFGGVCGLDAYADGRTVGSGLPQDQLDCTSMYLRLKLHVTGDMKEVFRTSVMQEFPFPEFDGEKFCPEQVVWYRIAQRYKLRFFNKPIYLIEYLEDGLSAGIVRVRHNSPLSSMTCYSEAFHYDIPQKEKVKSAINFWRFTPIRYYKKSSEMDMINFVSLACFPIGLLMRLVDIYRLKK